MSKTIEEEFEAVYNAHHKEIEEQLKIASRAIANAESISEEFGIPFSAGCSPLGQSYTPVSLKQKFPGLDTDEAADISGIYLGEYGYGWEHSSIC